MHKNSLLLGKTNEVPSKQIPRLILKDDDNDEVEGEDDLDIEIDMGIKIDLV